MEYKKNLRGSKWPADEPEIPHPSVVFLGAFHGGEPWHLVAIDEKRNPHARTFIDEGREALVVEWLEKHKRDKIYFSPNPLNCTDRKAEKADVKEARWLWADVDPPGTLADLDQWRAERLSESSELPPPTFFIDSGRGFWRFWKLKEAQPVDGDGPLTQLVESYARGIEKDLGGDHCHNIDRIARLPGTVNPKTKRVATVLEHHPERVYSLTDFPRVEAEIRVSLPGVEQEADGLTAIAVVARLKDLSPEARHRLEQPFVYGPLRLIKDGNVVLTVEREDCSEAIFRMGRDLRKAGATPAQALAVMRETAVWRDREARGKGENPTRLLEKIYSEEVSDSRNSLSLSSWLARELPPQEKFLGEVLGRGSKMLVSGQTGVGKTNFGVSLAAAVAAGRGFAGWESSGVRRRVMYIDGEMGARAFKGRMVSAAQLYGSDLDLFGYNRGVEASGSMAPLDSPEGHAWLKAEVAALKPDLVVFDSIRFLTKGNIAEEETWTRVAPVVEWLVRQDVAQVWLHHTGHDTSRAYGSSTISWGMEASIILEKIDGKGAAFKLKFDKDREKTPANFEQFEPRVLRLTDEGWRVSVAASPEDIEREQGEVGRRLIAAMQANPGGSIEGWAAAIGAGKTSAYRVLQRLVKEKLVVNRLGRYSLTASGKSALG